MKPSILRNLSFAFYGFGLSMGIIFPLYAQFFVEWKEGMQVWFIIGCLIAGLSIGVANYVLVNIILLKRLSRISDVANAISQKDLRHQCSMVSDDMVGSIIDSFNRMGETLRGMISDVGEASQQISQSSDHLNAVTAETNEHTKQQHSDTNQVLHSIGDMSASIRQIASNTNDAALAAQEANASSKEGKHIVNDTITQINNLAQDVEDTASMIAKLEDESQAIGSVLDVIRGIAEQTNLLALNAAIEAARAGESGRGFAVVADEVRSLASRTQQSTQDIQKMIENLQTKSKQAAQVMQKSRQQAKQSVETATKAGASLENIANAVANITELNKMISSASEQQEDAITSIHDKVSRISQIADYAVQSADTLKQAGNNLGALSKQLTRSVSEYQT